MNRKKITNQRLNRKNRVRGKLKSRSTLPRLVVTRSLKHISAQVVDNKGLVKASATSKNQSFKDLTKTEQAAKVGHLLATALKKKDIATLVLDRGYYKYHGRIKSLVEAVKSLGVKI
jgi:large subunit ribosomal protein L18